MKYIITENNLKNSIEQYLKDSFPEIVSINFKTKSVMLASDNGRTITRNVIEVVADPFNAREGNKTYTYSEAKKLKSRIWGSIDGLFGLGLEEYGSDWDMEYFIIKIESM
jgi:hypothetical protein